MNLSITILSGIGAIQGLLFAALILLKKHKQRYDWMLFGWFLVFSFHFCLKFGFEFSDHVLMDVLIMTLGFLHGPFFWIYSKEILGKGWYVKDLIHFLPFLVFLLGSFVVGDVHASWWEISILIPKLFVLTLYPTLVLLLISKMIENVRKTSSMALPSHYPWIKTAAYIFLMSTAISIVRLVTELIVGVSYFGFWDVLRYVLLVMIMGFFGLKYGVVYKSDELHTNPGNTKYKDSPLDEEKMDMIQRILEDFFQEKKEYLSPGFSLSELSEKTNIKKHHLSQVINLKMKTGFYELINSKRIDYAKEVLKQGNRNEFTLEGLGYECGFNSKSVFFNNFKKYTGKTPGSFKKEFSSN